MTTPRIQLRYPNDDDIAAIAERSAIEGVHDSSFMPFVVEWTDVAPPLQQRYSMQFLWSLRANWKPDDWSCNFVCIVDGRIVGTQSAQAQHFAALRSALTGSFLIASEQGKGIGKEMRGAILHLLFAGLGAERAETAAWSDNPQSLGVTRHLGYEFAGRKVLLSRGRPREQLSFVLTRDAWETRRRDDIIIEGLEPCLELFGLTDAAPASTDADTVGSSRPDRESN